MMVSGHKTRSVFDRYYIVVTLRDAANKTSTFQAHLLLPIRTNRGVSEIPE